MSAVAVALASNLLKIDRSKPFDPVAFIGGGWSIDEQDERALGLTEIDLNRVTFETALRSGEEWITGEENLRRLKEAGHIRLDVRVFQILWKNQSLIPESWKSRGYICFYGTILRYSSRDRCVLHLSWRGGRQDWYWDSSWIGGNVGGARNPSACLPS